LQLRFNKVIQSFIRFTINSEPIVWVGQKHFEIAVCKLWQLLSPAQREGFHFGINFNPSEVVIPDNSESKFENKGFTIIRKEDSVELKEFSEQFLAGESNAISRIENFVSAIEVSKPSVKEISTIAKGVSTFENLEKEKDLKLLNTLSNIVAKFSPDESKGTPFKARLVERISLLAEKADESEIFLLRNFQTKSFKGSEKTFSLSIDKWTSNYLLDEKQNQKVNYVPFIIQISKAQQSNWLIQLVSQNITNFLSRVNETTAKTIWRWITNEVKILKTISGQIENTKVAEKNLYESLPKTDDAILSEGKSFSLKRKWFRLHATILKSQFDFETAIKEQLKVDSDISYYEGIEIITKGVKPQDIITFAVSNGDKRCIQLSGKLCNSDKKLLAGLQIENFNWQEIWLASINNGNKTYDGIKEPLKTTHSLFDLLISGNSVAEDLLEKISETDFANVLTYQNRNNIWVRLPIKGKTKFLEKTSSALLQALSNNSTFQVPTDRELSDYIISNGITDFLYYNRNSIKNVLPVFNRYSQIREQVIKDYIFNYSGRIDVVDSVQLGKLAFSRNFSKVAHAIKSKAKEIKNFKYALVECHSLLGFFDKASLIFSGIIDDITISWDEWWSVFLDLSIRLYPEGPSENEIWKQAGGHKHDLNLKTTGKDSWIKAFHKLRNGACEDITPKKLLTAMLNEFPRNEELKTLKDLWNKI
jgi:hypothetical protein